MTIPSFFTKGMKAEEVKFDELNDYLIDLADRIDSAFINAKEEVDNHHQELKDLKEEVKLLKRNLEWLDLLKIVPIGIAIISLLIASLGVGLGGLYHLNLRIDNIEKQSDNVLPYFMKGS